MGTVDAHGSVMRIANSASATSATPPSSGPSPQHATRSIAQPAPRADVAQVHVSRSRPLPGGAPGQTLPPLQGLAPSNRRAGVSVGGAIGRRLPAEAAARSTIAAELPQISRAVSIATGGKLTTNQASCDVAAGLVLGRLRQLGLEARLNDAGGHVTVRVQTAGHELIVDPTLPQFLGDGTPPDLALRERGGFVGTEEELRTLIANEAASWTYSGEEFQSNMRAVSEEPSLSEVERARLLAENVECVVMSRLFTRHLPGALSRQAWAVAQRFVAFASGNEGRVDRADERAAFASLRR